MATFLPKPGSESTGNGAHVHMSIWKDGENLTGNKHTANMLSTEGEAFMAGIYEHFPCIFHFLCPSPNSLARLQAVGGFVGSSHHIWGIENKEAPIRVILPLHQKHLNEPTLIDETEEDNGVQHFEIKTMDHTANHYFALALIISFGTLGLKKGMKLPPNYDEDPELLS